MSGNLLLASREFGNFTRVGTDGERSVVNEHACSGLADTPDIRCWMLPGRERIVRLTRPSENRCERFHGKSDKTRASKQ